MKISYAVENRSFWINQYLNLGLSKKLDQTKMQNRQQGHLSMGPKIGLVGATGLVGRRFISYLEQKTGGAFDWPLKAFASPQSVGKVLLYKETLVPVEKLEMGCFLDCAVVFFDASDEVSKTWVPQAIQEGALVIDNSSVYRLDPTVPLVVPEINGHDLEKLIEGRSLISGPNCTTAQLVLALGPLDQAFGLEQVGVSTYQSVSGAGSKALEQLLTQIQKPLDALNHSLEGQLEGQKELEAVLNAVHQVEKKIQNVKEQVQAQSGAQSLCMENDSISGQLLGKSHQQNQKSKEFAFNAIAQVGGQMPWTSEELKLRHETRKILNRADLKISATCVRVPTCYGHGESVWVRLKNAPSLEDVQEVLAKAPGLSLECNVPVNRCEQVDLLNRKEVHLGRLRQDFDDPKMFHFYLLGDNIGKGAAYNGIQILEVAQDLLQWRVASRIWQKKELGVEKFLGMNEDLG